MDEALRSVITLNELEGLETNDIAAALGLPRGTVSSRLRRARTKVRELAAAKVLRPDVSGERRD
jgi:RNA polymerase sigma-70 factor (ECF subfamily)